MNPVDKILSFYDFDSKIIEVKTYGYGRINKTYLIICEDGKEYILQRINTDIFENVDGLMQNIDAVTNRLIEVATKRNENVDDILKLKRTKDGRLFVNARQFGAFRIFNFIENSKCYQSASNPTQMYELGRVIGKFHADLDGFDSSKLNITIPNFHNTELRLAKFWKSFISGYANKERIIKAKQEIKFCYSNWELSKIIVSKIESGEIPIRVTHNDTKINNVLFDANSDKAKCLLDFDTIMPDSLLYDVGDAVRFACNTSSEDEKNLDKVKFNKEYYKSFMEGYLSQMANKLNDTEKKLLVYAPMVMAYELGIRFLEDYINNDVYFGASENEDANLERARVQFKMLQELQNNFAFMESTVSDCIYISSNNQNS